MADTIVATYGADGFRTPGFTYCGFVTGSGSGTDPPADYDHIRVWLRRCSAFNYDVAHVTVVAHSDAGSPPDQFVWTATPGGTHITTFGDEDGGSGDLTFPNDFYDTGYFDIIIGSRADLSYCFTVTFTYCNTDDPLWDDDEDWHVGGPHW